MICIYIYISQWVLPTLLCFCRFISNSLLDTLRGAWLLHSVCTCLNSTSHWSTLSAPCLAAAAAGCVFATFCGVTHVLHLISRQESIRFIPLIHLSWALILKCSEKQKYSVYVSDVMTWRSPPPPVGTASACHPSWTCVSVPNSGRGRWLFVTWLSGLKRSCRMSSRYKKTIKNV